MFINKSPMLQLLSFLFFQLVHLDLPWGYSCLLIIFSLGFLAAFQEF